MGRSNVSPEVEAIVRRALEEDIGSGDVTTNCTVPVDLWLTGRFVAKAPGVIAGLEIAALSFWLLDERVKMSRLVEDGATVAPGQTIADVAGPARALLTGERTALNILQRMSGIATATRRFVEAVAGTRARILDTRKTAPGLRALDKLAVRIGGGMNHRIGLFDMVMIKNNHIAACGGSIAEAVQRVRSCAVASSAGGKRLKIEVEVRDLRELEEALALGVDIIMLDNMAVEDMRRAVDIVNGRVKLEASGNVTLDNVRVIAETGVDYISAGALTHSVKALDISLWLDEPHQS
ncbi:MAG: carboxylating nicotinate-nucleotide diphosphorylase [Anaerolineae bacterium]|nr:carboxylating nicotinate-nucleotide diphosphorylase [Candidatus Roseilinea sp.]MDW8449607.1 carboxylating nicotinate-nucleotide diphosphorylase [Anaerolineae bacterium]